MKNTIYLDGNFNFLLLENEEDTNFTRIFINIVTSDATNQALDISVAGGTPITESIPSEAVVNFELTQEYWADNDVVTITPTNDDITGETITIHFPDTFASSAALNHKVDYEFEIAAKKDDVSESGSGSGNGSGFNFVEIIRNVGFRLLDEPTDTSVYYDELAGGVQIKWTDPDDISANEPTPATWAGTVVVRKEGSAPLHKWDGTIITDCTTKNLYAVSPLVDGTTEGEKTYYYGIFPYHVAVNDQSNPIKHYRYTKVAKVTTPRSSIYTFRTNENIKVNPITKEAVTGNLINHQLQIDPDVAKVYDNGLAIILTGTPNALANLSQIKYIYYAWDRSSEQYTGYIELYDYVLEFAYFGKPAKRDNGTYNEYDVFMRNGYHDADAAVTECYINFGSYASEVNKEQKDNKSLPFYLLFSKSMPVHFENAEYLVTSRLSYMVPQFANQFGINLDADSYAAIAQNWDTSSAISFSALLTNNTKANDALVAQLFATWSFAAAMYLHYMFANTPITRLPQLKNLSMALEETYFMFIGCTQLQSADLGDWNLPDGVHMGTSYYTSSLTEHGAGQMFKGCTSLTSFNLGTNISYKASNEVLDYANMFEGCTSLIQVTLGNFYSVYSRSGYYAIYFIEMFKGCSSLTHIYNLSITAPSVNLYNAFYGCTSLLEIDLGLTQETTLGGIYSSGDTTFNTCTALRVLNLNNAKLTDKIYISSLTNLQTLHCPKTVSGITNLPKTMYDSQGNAYTTLPGNNITLYATNPAA